MPDDPRVIARQGCLALSANSAEAIEAAVHALLDDLVGPPDHRVVSVLFFTAPGIDAAFPAAAARRWGLTDASLLGLQVAATDGGELWLSALVHLAAQQSSVAGSPT